MLGRRADGDEGAESEPLPGAQLRLRALACAVVDPRGGPRPHPPRSRVVPRRATAVRGASRRLPGLLPGREPGQRAGLRAPRRARWPLDPSRARPRTPCAAGPGGRRVAIMAEVVAKYEIQQDEYTQE
jgi:hypothetical protein